VVPFVVGKRERAVEAAARRSILRATFTVVCSDRRLYIGPFTSRASSRRNDQMMRISAIEPTTSTPNAAFTGVDVAVRAITIH